VAAFKGTPEEIERQWYEQVYRGTGTAWAADLARGVDWLVPGSVLSLTNLYIGLKAGWGSASPSRQHLVLCDLDELAQNRHRAHADDHP